MLLKANYDSAIYTLNMRLYQAAYDYTACESAYDYILYILGVFGNEFAPTTKRDMSCYWNLFPYALQAIDTGY